MADNILFGERILTDALPKVARWLVVTAPPVRQWVERHLRAHTALFHEATTLDEKSLVTLESSLPPVDGVLGVGGGVAIDTAKYLAWRRQVTLCLAPSVISVDAFLTESIAVRRKGRVHYLGEVYPQMVIVDFSLVSTAPAELNRAGAGDILSIHTALWDWKLAADAGHAHFLPDIASESRQLLEFLAETAEEIRDATPDGIRTLVELYAGEVELCRRAGSSRPEEGSEHFWAYNVEYRYPRPYVHGELVSLGVLLMAYLQDNAPDWVADMVKRLGIRWQPQHLGLSREEVLESLLTARAYAEEDGLAYSVLNARPIDTTVAEKIVQSLNVFG